MPRAEPHYNSNGRQGHGRRTFVDPGRRPPRTRRISRSKSRPENISN